MRGEARKQCLVQLVSQQETRPGIEVPVNSISVNLLTLQKPFCSVAGPENPEIHRVRDVPSSGKAAVSGATAWTCCFIPATREL